MKKPGTLILDFSGCTAQTDEMEPRTNGQIPNPPSLTAQNPQPVKAVHLSAGNCIFFAITRPRVVHNGRAQSDAQ